jgi:hypothetical protein
VPSWRSFSSTLTNNFQVLLTRIMIGRSWKLPYSSRQCAEQHTSVYALSVY